MSHTLSKTDCLRLDCHALQPVSIHRSQCGGSKLCASHPSEGHELRPPTRDSHTVDSSRTFAVGRVCKRSSEWLTSTSVAGVGLCVCVCVCERTGHTTDSAGVTPSVLGRARARGCWLALIQDEGRVTSSTTTALCDQGASNACIVLHPQAVANSWSTSHVPSILLETHTHTHPLLYHVCSSHNPCAVSLQVPGARRVYLARGADGFGFRLSTNSKTLDSG